MFAVTTINAQLTYHHCTQVGVHSTVQRTNRFYSVDPAVCTLGYKCSTLQCCRLYWRECVGHLWVFQDHHSQPLEKVYEGSSTVC